MLPAEKLPVFVGQCVVTVESKNRIKVPNAVVDQVDWMKKAKTSKEKLFVAFTPLDELQGV